MGEFRCAFIPNVTPIQPDARVFDIGEDVCLRDIFVKGKKPTTGVFVGKMGTFLKIKTDGVVVPTPSFNVGKVLKPEEQARAIGETRKLAPDTENIIKKMLGKSRRRKLKHRVRKTRRAVR